MTHKNNNKIISVVHPICCGSDFGKENDNRTYFFIGKTKPFRRKYPITTKRD